MANLGTAYVNIVPAATGISGKITQAISPESAKPVFPPDRQYQKVSVPN